MVLKTLTVAALVISLLGCGRTEEATTPGPKTTAAPQLPERYRDLGDIEVEEALLGADTFTFYTIDPESHYKPDEENDDSVEKLYGWIVLGKAEVTDAAERHRLLAAMQRGIDDSDGTAAGCFNPRHAIDIQNGDDRITYVICFECLSISIHYGTGERGSKQTTAGPSPIFNEIAEAHGLKIAP